MSSSDESSNDSLNLASQYKAQESVLYGRNDGTLINMLTGILKNQKVIMKRLNELEDDIDKKISHETWELSKQMTSFEESVIDNFFKNVFLS